MAKLYSERDLDKYVSTKQRHCFAYNNPTTMIKKYENTNAFLQTQALSKAINSQETPVKQKHVRSAIIGTFHTQGATIFPLNRSIRLLEKFQI